MEEQNIITGLDIGTNSICTVIGLQREGGIEVIGLSTVKSEGVNKGVVSNIDATTAHIKQAIEEAELMAGVEIDSVIAGVSGVHIKGMNSKGMVTISRKDREISNDDVERAIMQAQTIQLPADREIIHVLPREFLIDDQEGIKDPVGIAGTRLEVEVHIITAAAAAVSNLKKAIDRAGLDVERIVLQSLAASEAALSADEKDLGVLLVDFGGGKTDVIVFNQSSVAHTSVLGVGAQHITQDISYGLKTPLNAAEQLKKRSGYAVLDAVTAEEHVEVPSPGGRPPRMISRRLLAEIIQPRVQETADLVVQAVQMSGYKNAIGAGVVVCGGGAQLAGIEQCIEQHLSMPVRIGIPQGVHGPVDKINSPVFTTAVGLVKLGMQYRDFIPERRTMRKKADGEGIFGKMGSWLKDFF